MSAQVGIVLLFPDLLGTYGDSGNAVILAQRLRWRGFGADVHTVLSGQDVPDSAEFYVMGGGEDLPQALAARQLGRSGPLHRAVDTGAAVLAVCAGLQILGTSFVGPDGAETDGLGLVDCRSVRGRGPRAVGELVVEPAPDSGVEVPTGYENHGGVTVRGPSLAPAARVRSGVGNGDRTDGFRAGRIWATYLHGPVLARNPTLADWLIASALGDDAVAQPLDDRASAALRQERLEAAATNASPARASRRRILAAGPWRR
ncbi:MAG: type 1 glutamine amidotransferase [Acidimicrobiales bacterium]